MKGVPRSTAVPLIDSLVHEVVASEHDIDTFVDPPAEGLTSFRTAVDLALTRIREGQVETRWSGANARYAPSDPMPSDLLPSDPDWAGGTVYTDVRERPAAASADTLWHVIAGIGGDRGWYSFPLGWRARGVMDRLVGGVGLRRGRRDADRLKVGDALDWWRVEECVEGSDVGSDVVGSTTSSETSGGGSATGSATADGGGSSTDSLTADGGGASERTISGCGPPGRSCRPGRPAPRRGCRCRRRAQRGSR